ncbi:VWA domain-containing protein [Agaribacterium sp. ZY112]|uniref:VWA domain-containing protein n=1 Tax=Agaribacterium sp. ZY112 TaxID=3233574 RepID=UPI003524DDB5
MTELITQFHFLRPWLLLALIPLIYFTWMNFRHNQASTRWKKAIDARFLNVLAGTESSNNKSNSYFLVLLGALLILALAGPTWLKQKTNAQQNQQAVVIVLDLSPSMAINDIQPSRIKRAQLKLQDLLNSRKDGLTALVVYSGDAHIVTPLSDDNKTLKSLLPNLSPAIMPSPGSNIEAGLQLAENLVRDAGAQPANIIVVSDGIDSSALTNLKNITKKSKNHYSIWGIGTASGGPIPLADGNFARKSDGNIVVAQLDHEQMQAAANSLNALYIPFSNDDLDLNTLFDFALKDSSIGDSQSEFNGEQWQDLGPYLLIPALFLFLFAFRRGQFICLLLGMSFYGHYTEANVVSDVWKTPDQRAYNAFEEGNYDKAQTLFNDPEWKASSLYKNGQYQEAAELWGQLQGPEAAYNSANSLALSGQLEKALEKYEQALEQQPDMQDAQKNKAIIEQLLKQQEQQEQQNQDQSEQDQNQQDEQQKQDGASEDSNEQEQNEQNQDGQSQQEQSESQQEQNESQDSPKQNSDSDSGSQQGSKNDTEQNNEQEASSNKADTEQKSDKEALDQHYNKQESSEQPSPDPQSEEAQQQAQKAAEAKQEQAEQEQAQQQAQEQYREVERLSEEDQALEQWLRKVPDDPSTLLRNKFEQQYRQQKIQRQQRYRAAPDETQQRW